MCFVRVVCIYLVEYLPLCVFVVCWILISLLRSTIRWYVRLNCGILVILASLYINLYRSYFVIYM